MSFVSLEVGTENGEAWTVPVTVEEDGFTAGAEVDDERGAMIDFLLLEKLVPFASAWTDEVTEDKVAEGLNVDMVD